MRIALVRRMNRSDAPIARPCGADWKAMSPLGTARLCGACDKLVHDLSAMTEREARSLLRARATEGLCVRYLHDANGEIWFRGRTSEGARLVPAGRLARRGAAVAAAATLVLTPVLTEACGGAGPDPNPYNSFESSDAGTTPGSRTAADPSVTTHAASDAGGTEAGPTEDAAADAGSVIDADGGPTETQADR